MLHHMLVCVFQGILSKISVIRDHGVGVYKETDVEMLTCCD